MAKTAKTGFFFKLSEEERTFIEQKMALIGVRNMSAYIRKMCIDGRIVRVHVPELKEIIRLMRITSNNVNQISKCVNSVGEAQRADVEQVRVQLEAIWDGLGELLRLFGEIN